MQGCSWAFIAMETYMRTRVFTQKVLEDNEEKISITTISQFEALNHLKPADDPNCFSSNCLTPRAKKLVDRDISL